MEEIVSTVLPPEGDWLPKITEVFLNLTYDWQTEFNLVVQDLGGCSPFCLRKNIEGFCVQSFSELLRVLQYDVPKDLEERPCGEATVKPMPFEIDIQSMPLIKDEDVMEPSSRYSILSYLYAPGVKEPPSKISVLRNRASSWRITKTGYYKLECPRLFAGGLLRTFVSPSVDELPTAPRYVIDTKEDPRVKALAKCVEAEKKSENADLKSLETFLCSVSVEDKRSALLRMKVVKNLGVRFGDHPSIKLGTLELSERAKGWLRKNGGCEEWFCEDATEESCECVEESSS